MARRRKSGFALTARGAYRFLSFPWINAIKLEAAAGGTSGIRVVIFHVFGGHSPPSEMKVTIETTSVAAESPTTSPSATPPRAKKRKKATESLPPQPESVGKKMHGGRDHVDGGGFVSSIIAVGGTSQQQEEEDDGIGAAAVLAGVGNDAFSILTVDRTEEGDSDIIAADGTSRHQEEKGDGISAKFPEISFLSLSFKKIRPN